MVPKWCPDVKNRAVKRKTAIITRYKKSLCLQGFSQITYKKICGNTRRFWLFHDPRNQFAGNRTWVRIPPAAPRWSKLCIACSDLFYKSERTHTAAAPPFQTANACVGLRFEKTRNEKRKYPNLSHLIGAPPVVQTGGLCILYGDEKFIPIKFSPFGA